MLDCTHCGTPLPAERIDQAREIANCGACGRLLDIRAQLLSSRAAATPAEPPRARPGVELPPGMSLEADVVPTPDGKTGRQVVIRRPWLRSKHWVFLVVCVALSAALAVVWQGREPGVWLVLGTLLVLSWDYNVATMFVNATAIRADAAGVRVSHGPLPSPFGRSRSIERTQIRQLFAVKQGPLYAVKALFSDESATVLVAPLISEEQALFVEQQLESVLGLVDFAVPGELGDSRPLRAAGKPVGGAKPGAAVALLVPLLLVGTLAMFFVASSTEVNGSFRARGPAGTWTFAPDACISGQREGYGGVELRSGKDSSRVVRVVNDPVKGALVVVAQPGRKNQVFDSANCAAFQVAVERGSTNINDIWVVNGQATLDCSELTGSVSFQGCH